MNPETDTGGRAGSGLSSRFACLLLTVATSMSGLAAASTDGGPGARDQARSGVTDSLHSFGHDVRELGIDVGHKAADTGRAIGRAARDAGIAVGHAARDGSKALVRGLKGE